MGCGSSSPIKPFEEPPLVQSNSDSKTFRNKFPEGETVPQTSLSKNAHIKRSDLSLLHVGAPFESLKQDSNTKKAESNDRQTIKETFGYPSSNIFRNKKSHLHINSSSAKPNQLTNRSVSNQLSEAPPFSSTNGSIPRPSSNGLPKLSSMFSRSIGRRTSMPYVTSSRRSKEALSERRDGNIRSRLLSNSQSREFKNKDPQSAKVKTEARPLLKITIAEESKDFERDSLPLPDVPTELRKSESKSTRSGFVLLKSTPLFSCEDLDSAKLKSRGPGIKFFHQPVRSLDRQKTIDPNRHFLTSNLLGVPSQDLTVSKKDSQKRISLEIKTEKREPFKKRKKASNLYKTVLSRELKTSQTSKFTKHKRKKTLQGSHARGVEEHSRCGVNSSTLAGESFKKPGSKEVYPRKRKDNFKKDQSCPLKFNAQFGSTKKAGLEISRTVSPSFPLPPEGKVSPQIQVPICNEKSQKSLSIFKKSSIQSNRFTFCSRVKPSYPSQTVTFGSQVDKNSKAGPEGEELDPNRESSILGSLMNHFPELDQLAPASPQLHPSPESHFRLPNGVLKDASRREGASTESPDRKPSSSKFLRTAKEADSSGKTESATKRGLILESGEKLVTSRKQSADMLLSKESQTPNIRNQRQELKRTSQGMIFLRKPNCQRESVPSLKGQMVYITSNQLPTKARQKVEKQAGDIDLSKSPAVSIQQPQDREKKDAGLKFVNKDLLISGPKDPQQQTSTPAREQQSYRTLAVSKPRSSCLWDNLAEKSSPRKSSQRSLLSASERDERNFPAKVALPPQREASNPIAQLVVADRRMSREFGKKRLSSVSLFQSSRPQGRRSKFLSAPLDESIIDNKFGSTHALNKLIEIDDSFEKSKVVSSQNNDQTINLDEESLMIWGRNNQFEKTSQARKRSSFLVDR